MALERVLGTVAGGLLGYGLALFNDLLPFLDQPFFTVGALMIVAFSSILLGQKLRLDYSGRLFIMTFILVVMAAPRTAGTLVSSTNTHAACLQREGATDADNQPAPAPASTREKGRTGHCYL